MSHRRRFCIFVPLAVTVAIAVYCCLLPPAGVPQEYVDIARAPSIDPDYAGCTIPPNIAPLNFVVGETGVEYRVRVYGGKGEGFVISSRSGRIAIPMDKWKAMLELNRGGDLHFDVYTMGRQGRWRRFSTITNSIAREDVDSHLVYRRLKPVHTIYTNMGTYQRDVSTYRESPVLLSDPGSRRCVNCHTFVNNNPDTMCLHVRGPGKAAMILAKNGNATKINTRTDFNARPASYTAWHPSGRLAAFASIGVIQFHHAVGNSRGVMDLASDVCLYIVDSNRVTSNREMADPDRLETFPTWSPDGKHLYFCSAERVWDDRPGVPSEYHQIRYDLARVSYDPATGQCGKRQTILSSGETGLSINEPRISPDGRFLLFCMARHGSFPVFLKSSDLYMMDLETRRYWRLDINSDQSDSWHCWSTNSRWIVFASKRRDGLFGRVYFSYVDPQGKARKPVLLPQRDPEFYGTFIENFNAPELITKPISIKQMALARAVESSGQADAAFVPMPPAPGADTRGRQEPPATQPRKAVKNDLKEAQRYYRLARGLARQGETGQAVEQYRLSIECLSRSHAANVPALRELAWIYATDPSEKLRNGQEAVSLAARARGLAALQIKYARSDRARKHAKAAVPQLHDTLAVALAECGRFDNAAKLALEAERLALDEGQIELAVKIRARVELYLVGKPYRSSRRE